MTGLWQISPFVLSPALSAVEGLSKDERRNFPESGNERNIGNSPSNVNRNPDRPAGEFRLVKAADFG
jgi:hypothetical protein